MQRGVNERSQRECPTSGVALSELDRSGRRPLAAQRSNSQGQFRPLSDIDSDGIPYRTIAAPTRPPELCNPRLLARRVRIYPKTHGYHEQAAGP